MNKRRILISGLIVTYTLLFSACNLIIKTSEAIAKQTVATVGKTKITRGQIDNSYEFALNKMYYVQYNGVVLDPERDLSTYFQYKDYALDDVIDMETVLLEAQNQNVVIDEAKLIENVDKAIEDFKGYFTNEEDNTFNQEDYDGYFKSLGITEQDYTEYISKSEKVELIWEQLLKDIVLPTDEEIKDDYDTNKETYQKEYNTLDTDHILISTQDDIRTDEEALAIAKEIKAKLDDGADFAELAAEYTEDPSGKDDGGKVGEQTFGTLDSGYVDGAKVLTPGSISGPVKSSFGYHIIKLNSISFDGDSYEKMKPIISEKLYDGKKSEERNNFLEKYKEEMPVVKTKYMKNMYNFK